MNVEKSLREMLKILRFWYSFLNTSKYKKFSGEMKKSVNLFSVRENSLVLPITSKFKKKKE